MTGDDETYSNTDTDAYDEADTFERDVCGRCLGSGYYSMCIDDLCHGREECIHGDDATCPDCDGEGA